MLVTLYVVVNFGQSCGRQLNEPRLSRQGRSEAGRNRPLLGLRVVLVKFHVQPPLIHKLSAKQSNSAFSSTLLVTIVLSNEFH